MPKRTDPFIPDIGLVPRKRQRNLFLAEQPERSRASTESAEKLDNANDFSPFFVARRAIVSEPDPQGIGLRLCFQLQQSPLEVDPLWS